MDIITRTYYENARRLKLPVTYLSNIDFLRISLGKKNYYFQMYITPMNHGSSILQAMNKFNFNSMLKHKGFPVPNCVVIERDIYLKHPLKELLGNLRFPLVVKPLMNTFGGKDVVCNITTLAQLSRSLTNLFAVHELAQVEEYQKSLREYRVLLLKNKVIAVAERFHASVIGNGRHTIEQLISNYNQNTPNKITIDVECLRCLSDQGLSLDHVLAQHKKVQLQYAVNRSLGGRVTSLGKKINSKNAKYLGAVAKLIDLEWVGLDVLCEDINKPFTSTKCFILEANFGPDITLHEFPDHGVRMNVSRELLIQLIYRHPLAYIIHRFKLLMYRFRGDA